MILEASGSFKNLRPPNFNISVVTFLHPAQRWSYFLQGHFWKVF